MVLAANRSRPTKQRRTQADIDALCDAMRELIAAEQPMTCRQVFYRMVSEGLIPKTEAAYKTTIVRLLGVMRRDHRLPFDWLADNTRWVRQPQTYSGLDDALEQLAQYYRRAVWDDLDCRVEVWLEKDALAGVVNGITDKWDVPLAVTRGYPSLSYLHSAAETIRYSDKPTFIYYFGDRDPSGVDIPRKVEADLREFSGGAEIHFECVAVTPDQIREFDLPTRPTKKTDSRAKGFDGESVELDAIPPADLRRMVNDCISQHVDLDLDHQDNLAAVQREEREALRTLAAEYDPRQPPL